MTLATRSALRDLHRLLRHWEKETIASQTQQWEWMRSHSVTLNTRGQARRPGQSKRMLQASRALTRRMARMARPYLGELLKDNKDRTPEELETIADHLSPGGAHDGGFFIRIVMKNCGGLSVCPLLVAATIQRNWHGGKHGFQFLPIPQNEAEAADYNYAADELLSLIEEGTGRDPRRVLTGQDRAFYDSLPDQFTVYRGCNGISSELAATGVCWTTKRTTAEWFAHRFSSAEDPAVVVMARIKKSDVVLVNACEAEIVCQPRWHRAIGSRKRPRGGPASWEASVQVTAAELAACPAAAGTL